jgi:hypothetical protein
MTYLDLGPEGCAHPRCELLAEHSDQHTAGIDDRPALRLYRKIAGENRSRRDARDFDRQGPAFSFDPRELRRVIEP